jgi:endoglucanase
MRADNSRLCFTLVVYSFHSPYLLPSPGTDAAAGAASAFASAAFLYSLTSSFNTSSAAFSPSSTLPSSIYSATLLQHAKDLYAFANGTAPTLYQDSVPAVADVYASSAYIDELIVAGLWVSRPSRPKLFR